ncbi:FmdB family zinc ribbon protein [Citricoccus sp.]|uniref:FmdB family zinc ribbon protein n=1 Tax=Citricoccus sp. TaxID=1978372 RepID=UPI00260509D3|nr:FmdB family zinc ribbon protein [Citricoccus sp.]HRO29576.1 zinc ribbon domain-containing protein [Citricoccus sp.]HRO93605.1 zinc ribbon domain-containing protein [Citricoccus sp.]
MPTYAYACKDCGHAFDIVQSFSDDSLTVCPECEGTLRKKFNSVGVVFKGSGFYRTDSRSDGSGSKGSGASTAASSNGSGSSEGSSASSTGSTDSSSPAPAEKTSGSPAPASSGSTPAKTPAPASV